MKIDFVKSILTFSILATMVTPVVWADEPIKVGIQRSFVNLGFETIPNASYRNTSSTDYCPQGSNWTNAHCLFKQEGVSGWKTTAPKLDGANRTIDSREIEFWTRASSTTGTTPIAAAEGKYYAELNGHKPAALYQNVCIAYNDELTWSLQHAKRHKTGSSRPSWAGGGTYPDEKMNFFITTESAIMDDNRATALPIPSAKYMLKENITYLTEQKWLKHSGSLKFSDVIADFRYDPTDENSKPTKLAKVLSFVFQAVSPEGGSEPEEGNFLDDIILKLKPAVEFSAVNDKFIENAEGEYPIRFKIVGLITSQEEMPSLNFKIDYSDEEVGKNAEQIADLIDKRLKYGTDYKISSKSGELSAIKIDGTTVTFTYKPIYNNGLDYTKGVEVDGLTIKLINNDKIDGDKRLPVSFDLNKDSNAVSMSLSSCDQATSIQKFELQVMDDDVDLAVTKTMLTEQSTFANNNMRVSYEIDLSNNDRSLARDVFLRDELFSNLEWDTNTQLTCIDNPENAVCPKLPQDALNQLFNEGLSLGDLPANTKLKFVLSNLKLKSTDEKKKDYEGLVINKAEVSAKGSNDVNLENNTSTAENIYPAKSDLMNVGTANTGEGLFVIDQDGKALWEQAAQENKAYFPLKIKNYSTFAQDYQLYASPTAIQPATPNQELSGLKQDTITSYTEKLKIDFFEVKDGQCNADMPSARQVTQLTVNGGATGEVCAVITVYPSANPKHDIWFAIESLQTGLGDVIKDKVTTAQVLRQLELVNDQKAQLNIGGTYVFTHRLFNKGTIDESKIGFQLISLKEDDGFLYTLFIDNNKNGQLDADDTMVLSTDEPYEVKVNDVLELLVKAQAPSTATNGMMSQVKLEVIPSNENQSIFLESLVNTDTVFVGSDQVQVTKMQYKQPQCTPMSKEEVKKEENYSISSETIGASDCLIYKITIKNIGSEILKNIDVNDMYPAYTQKWELGQNILPMTSSGEVVEVKGDQVKTTILELLPQQEKSLYFGIKLH